MSGHPIFIGRQEHSPPVLLWNLKMAKEGADYRTEGERSKYKLMTVVLKARPLTSVWMHDLNTFLCCCFLECTVRVCIKSLFLFFLASKILCRGRS